MNRTFKVVFNKARGALTVVNEVTSSVQAKGTKTVVAAAAAALMTVGSFAAHAEEDAFGSAAFSFNGEQVLQNTGYTGDAKATVTSTEDGVNITFEGVVSDWESNEVAYNYGAFTNLRVINNQQPAAVNFTVDGNFENNSSANAGGAMTIWHDRTSADSQQHTIKGTFSKNSAANLGGAVSLMSWGLEGTRGQTTISATFEKNSSEGNGGAVYSENNDLTVSSSSFTGNTAVNYGGALYLTDTSATIEDSVFGSEDPELGSNSGSMGGAIYTDGKLEISNTNFIGNSATTYGGAIAGTIDGKGDVSLSNGIFSKNQAGSGGAIALWSNGDVDEPSASSLAIDGTTFDGNTADRKGGAIAFLQNHTSGGQLVQATIANATFTGNKAGLTGGALQLEYADATISGSTFTGNSATENGGAVYVADDASLALAGDNVFSDNTAGDKANDIYSEGVINVQSGKTTLGSGLVLANEAEVTIGSAESGATLEVENLEMGASTTITLGSQKSDALSDASYLAVRNVKQITGGIIAGENSVVSLGSSSAEGAEAVSAMLAQNGLTWGEDVTSAVYLGSAVDITKGYLVADGSGTVAGETGTLTVAKQGLLAANQAAVASGESLVTGTVSFEGGSTLAIVNATEGEFKLADNVAVADGAAVSVITDNPFYEAQLAANGSITTAQDTANGVSSIASAGLQAMTRRADFVFSQTIADRASIDQELQPGANLWVDVSGENYQMDGMDYGAEFEADTFYGTFGGDVKLGDAYTLGAAFQYGDGSLRSSVNGVKNDVTNYGLALYGTAKFGAAKVVGELSYIWGENDITASQAALNQSVDTSIYSAGVTGMYELRAGGFSFIPSIGLRVSQLETDAMRVGDVSIEDQDQTLFQIPVALRINGADMNAGGWKLAPSFKIAYVPTFGDTEINVHNIEADVIDTSPVQMDLGLRAGTENLLLNATFSLGAGREGSSSVGGKIGLKYAF